jgi:hypothetical protein
VRKKVFVRLKGGLGNQLFIYAFGIAQSKRLGADLIIDNISGFGSKFDEYKSEYALGSLNLTDSLISNTLLKYLVANKYFWHVATILGFCHVEKAVGIYEDVSENKHFFYEGYWQSYRYFNDYRILLRNNLIAEDQQEMVNAEYRDLIQQATTPVAIGMRFYEETKSASLHHPVKAAEFYRKAVEDVESSVSGATYFIFSTDLTMARDVMDTIDVRNVVYIEPVRDKRGVIYDLYLMMLCKHFVISNGTFYWWAAYLGETPESIVVAPDQGFVNSEALPPSWTRI